MEPFCRTTSSDRPTAIRLALACDLRLVRAAFHSALAAQRRYSIVWSGGVELDDRQRVATLEPLVTLLDLRDPWHEGLAHLRTWRDTCTTTRLLLLRPRDRVESLDELFAAGASGVVAREDEPQVLRLGIEALANGRPFLARSLRGSGPLVRWLPQEEQDFLRSLALGRSFSELAAAADRSVAELREAGRRLMELLGCTTRDELLHVAIRHGLLPRNGTD